VTGLQGCATEEHGFDPGRRQIFCLTQRPDGLCGTPGFLSNG